MRTPLLPIGRLGDVLHKYIPDLPPSSMYGQACHYMEPFCGEKLCSITGKAWGHISWSVPLLPATYFIPGAFPHFFLFFVPVLILGDAVKKIMMVITIVAGPMVTMYFASSAMETYVFEWATIYCFAAAILTLQAYVFELHFPKSFAPELSREERKKLRAEKRQAKEKRQQEKMEKEQQVPRAAISLTADSATVCASMKGQ